MADNGDYVFDVATTLNQILAKQRCDFRTVEENTEEDKEHEHSEEQDDEIDGHEQDEEGEEEDWDEHELER